MLQRTDMYDVHFGPEHFKVQFWDNSYVCTMAVAVFQKIAGEYLMIDRQFHFNQYNPLLSECDIDVLQAVFEASGLDAGQGDIVAVNGVIR